MGVVLVDLAALERRLEAVAVAEESDESPVIPPRACWSPTWGSLSWARERYGFDFLRSYAWLTPQRFLSTVLDA